MNLVSRYVRDSALSCFDGPVTMSVKKRNESEVRVYQIPASPKRLCRGGTLMDAHGGSAIEGFQ